YYPLGLALLLLLLEVFVPQARRKQVASVALGAMLTLVGCKDQERQMFTRHSPVVDQAVVAIRTVDAGAAHTLLSDYLSTGKCKDGTLGTPDRIRERPNATLDLGLTLFQLAERYGGEFGQPPPDEQDPNSGQLLS